MFEPYRKKKAIWERERKAEDIWKYELNFGLGSSHSGCMVVSLNLPKIIKLYRTFQNGRIYKFHTILHKYQLNIFGTVFIRQNNTEKNNTGH